MARSVLSEWSGPELIYVAPVQTVRSFGYDNRKTEQTPEHQEYRRRVAERVAEADGEPSPERVEFPDPEMASAIIKEVAQGLGADMVGITHVDQHYVYKGQEVSHEYAIVIALAMDYDVLKDAPNKYSGTEILRIYDATGRIVTGLAKYIRDRGYPARTHTMRSEQIAMLPHAYKAGLGELGKHGSLINLELGSSFRVAVVTTDLPMTVDSPRLEGLEDLCATCNMCTKFCPGDAISDEKQEVRGVLKWVVDTEKCAPYFGTYNACGICLAVCPVNAKAFGGRFKNAFIETIKGIDLQEWRKELQEGLQEPWAYIETPTEFSENWRMQVKPKK